MTNNKATRKQQQNLKMLERLSPAIKITLSTEESSIGTTCIEYMLKELSVHKKARELFGSDSDGELTQQLIDKLKLVYSESPDKQKMDNLQTEGSADQVGFLINLVANTVQHIAKSIDIDVSYLDGDRVMRVAFDIEGMVWVFNTINFTVDNQFYINGEPNWNIGGRSELIASVFRVVCIHLAANNLDEITSQFDPAGFVLNKIRQPSFS